MKYNDGRDIHGNANIFWWYHNSSFKKYEAFQARNFFKYSSHNAAHAAYNAEYIVKLDNSYKSYKSSIL